MKTNSALPSPKVLLIHAARQAMGDARRRAEAMAQVLGAELIVVKLSRPTTARAHVFFPQAHRADGLRVLQEALREARTIERWQAARDRKGLPPLEVLCSSPSVDALVEVCRQPGVALVVIPASFAWFASRLTGLAARAGVPVLLARPPDGDERLVVATNLEDPTRPVIHQALALSARLELPLTIVHNAPGFGAQLAAAGMAAMPMVAPDDGEVVAETERLLRQEFAGLSRPPEVTVTRRLDSATGILEASIQAHADLIVLGVRTHSQPGMFVEHVAERVCRAAARSVLLVPV
ncbi:MAG: universal stress protein [Archangium sp.]|nr:universal stress protein [Archangium sp.]MDP3153271.1 universal stress protein [Archangium sp.]MDP3569639.1 universal stress protein [Archangium sp.]